MRAEWEARGPSKLFIHHLEIPQYEGFVARGTESTRGKTPNAHTGEGNACDKTVRDITRGFDIYGGIPGDLCAHYNEPAGAVSYRIRYRSERTFGDVIISLNLC